MAVLPVGAAIVYTQAQERRGARARTIADNLRLARLAATEQASVLEGARRLLLTIARMPPLSGDDSRPCVELLTRILRDHPGYFNLTVANADGSFFCAAAPIDSNLLPDARGRTWFERVLQNRTTAVGDYQISATTGKPAIVVAHPLVDASGSIARIATATIGLDQLHQSISRAELPKGATLTLFDRTRTILARFPDGDAWVGRQIPANEAVDHLRSGRPEAVSEMAGVDGVNRLYVTVQVPTPLASGEYVRMGIDHDLAFGDADRVFRQYLWLLGIAMLAAIGSAAIAGQMFVVAPMRTLTAVAKRLASGELTARAELASAIAGVSELGDAVNAMAAAVDTRQRERDRAEAELRESEDRYRLLFASNPHPMWVYDLATLEFLEVNEAAVRRYGYTRDEFLAMRIVDIRAAEAVERLRANLAAARWAPPGRAWRHRVKSGEIIDVEITSHTVTFGDYAAALVTAEDVTDRVRAETALAERTAMTALTADVGVALNRPGDVRVCLQHCAEALVVHLDAAAARIWRLNPSGDVLELVAGAGMYSDIDATHRRVPLGQLTIGRIAEEQRPHITNDVIHDPLLRDADWARHEGMAAFAGYPLVVEARVVGVMGVFASRPFSDAVAGAIGSVAELVALGITRDRAEGARRLLAAIVESSEDAIFGTTLDGTVMSWNSGAERLLGYAAEEIVGGSVSLLCPPERTGELAEFLLRLRAGQYVANHETVRRRKDGTGVPVSLTLSPIRDSSGQIAGISAMMRDITERQRAERTVREREERIRLLARAVESTNEMVCVADVSDRITFVNAAFLRAYGYSADEVIGQTAALVQSLDPAHASSEEIVGAMRRDGWSGELMTRCKDGAEIRINLNTSAIRDERGAVVGLLGVARDVTEERSLEEQLRQAQKMEAIGQLAGGVAHDFNNLLTAIQGFAGLVAETLAEGDERRADVDEIRNAAERAAALTRQLLAFSRKQILATRVLHVGDVVGELTPMLRRLLGETIDLTTTVRDRGLVKADPGQLQQVIMNLAVNARDAMPAGGRLSIETADLVLDEAFARQHPSVAAGPHVVIAVRDNGHGMDEATARRIFEPFFTTKPKGQGTGLGLATVYGIVKQSGGSIWVESEVGRGTTFRVYLPRTDEIEAVAAAAPVDTRALRGQETILLVEDEDLVRDYVYRVLSRRGYVVHALPDPRRAIEYAGAHRGAIDLVFSDVMLPDMSGKAMVEQLRHCHPESKILYMSGYADDAIVEDGVLERGMAFLHKPFTADALAAKVRDVLDARN